MTPQAACDEKTNSSLATLDRGRRSVEGGSRRLVAGISLLLALFHLYTAALGSFEVMIQRSVHLLGMLLLAVALYPARSSSARHRISLGDSVLLVLTLLPFGYLLLNYEHVVSRIGFFTPVTKLEAAMGCLLIVVLLEATRRTVGLSLPILIVIFVIYGLSGSWWPGFLRHGGNSIATLVDQLVLQPEGVFGTILGVSATYLVLFVILAAFLMEVGTGDFFLHFSTGLAGARPGGPAKIAVVASCFFGTISGSPVANVVGTGSFTIPLMIRTGYQPHFAGAVEAVASTGGQIMPPVMGAAAFVISEYIGVPYTKLAWHAILPALLYYLAVYAMVHLEALKVGLRGVDDRDRPRWQTVVAREGYFTLPVVTLVALMAAGYTPVYAGFYAIISALLLGFLNRRSRLNLPRILSALEAGVEGAIQVAVVCGAAGIVIGIISLTGVGPRLGGLIVSFAGGSRIWALVLTALVCLLLGMGLPATACYIIPAALMAPALIRLGLPLIGVHLFIFYFAIISAITPPVAVAAYAGAAIAGASPWRTGFTAFRLGLTAYIVPFMFVFYPSLLLIGPMATVIATMVSAILGVVALAAGLEGYWYGLLRWPGRVAMTAAALLLIQPGLLTDMLGLMMATVVTFLQRQRSDSSMARSTDAVHVSKRED